VRYDRHGFRNTGDLHEADIVMLGDSYIEGYMMPDALMVTTRLSQLQGKTVANLGHSGYGPQQELVVLKRYGFNLHPKTVIWAFFEGNDFHDLDYYDAQRPSQPRPFWQTIWYRSLVRNALSQVLHPTGGCTRSPRIAELHARFTDARNHTSRIFFAPSEVQGFSERQLNKTIAYIAEAARLCRERNIQFVVAFIPEKYRVYHSLRNVELTSSTVRSWQVNSLPDEMGMRLAELNLGIQYVDLTQPLQEASQEGIATYLADDTHWTEAGNQLVAEVLDRALRLLPPRTRHTLEARTIHE
jgi:lysophospholipase L1-like esterase